MSKNLTRKGLAFGAIVALGSSLLAGAPANADNTGPITLLPDGATATNATNSSIIGAGITMTATLNPALQAAAGNGALEAPIASAGYIISNPGEAKLTLELTTAVLAAREGFLVYNADGNTAQTLAGAYSSTLVAVDIGVVDTGTYVIYDDSDVYVTNAKKIFIGAGVDGTGSAKDTISPLKIDAAGTSTVSVTVQAVTDTETQAAATTGKVGAFENASAVETVTLYPVSAVTATTAITQLAVAGDTTPANNLNLADVTDYGFAATVVYGSSINPYAVAAATTVQLRKDGGSPLFLNPQFGSGGDGTALAAQVDRFTFAASKKLTSTTFYKTSSLTTTDPGQATDLLRVFDAGVYSASAYFNNGSSQIAVGAASAVVDLNNGLVAGITSTDAYMTETANVDFASDVAAIRTGTNAVTVVAKSNIADKAGQKFRATVTATAIDATSTVAVSGSASTLAATDDVVVAYATSDSTGKVSFTLTNSGAVKADNIDVDISTLTAAGTYTTADNVDITWADAALTSFSAVPGNYISGANPTLTYKAKDQFGQPVSKTATGALSVTVVAKIGGIEKKLLLSDTKSMVDGSVAFTFANFATASIPGQVQATLFEGVTQSSVGASGVIVANVYNTSDTATITVLDSYATTITYKDFVVGDATDATVAAAVTLTGIDGVTGSTISGSVQNASAVGQPGAAVTVAADGILFYDAAQGIYAEDSIVIYTNEYGAYSVKAIAHMINTAGHAVTITTGGKTASTLLKAYLPVDELTAGNLALSWDLPAELVMNTTYALTVTLTDKWGNPVATPGANSVSIEGNGSVLVNGLVTATAKKFGTDGKTTVFVRSIKDIAGPGAVSATISAASGQYAIDPAVSGDAAGFDQFGSLVAITTDVTSTVWDETAFASALSAVVDVKETASAVVAGGLKAGEVVNVGTFNNKIVVYAKGMKGETITWKIAGKWVKVEVTKDYQLFDRLTAAIGVNVNVDVYRATVKTPLLSKTVLTK